MSGGLTRSSRPQVSSVGQEILCIIAQYGGMSAVAMNCCCISKDAEPYIVLAVAKASGFIATSQRSLMSSSVTRVRS